MKCAKVIRSVTVAPVMAAAMLVVLFLLKLPVGVAPLHLALALLFLTVLPILAYPLQRFIPGYKGKGRDGQRSLAMLFAVGGYILGCIVSFVRKAPWDVAFIYIAYLLSGVLVTISNKLFKLRASGHACGVTGPIVLLIHFGVPALIPGVILAAAVWWASLKMKRHTVTQLVGGTAIPLIAVVIMNLL